MTHLLARARAGVQVRVVLDRSQLDGRGSKLPELAAAGIPVRIDLAVPLMHDKFIVADRDTTQTGSMNYTQAGALHNAENVLVIWHHAAVAAAAFSRGQSFGTNRNRTRAANEFHARTLINLGDPDDFRRL
ncbi:phospholipase D-like domain-containing protein [Burkholderia glumae]|uniref:phospholipase D-like domain-containing protein n=1 Tax=Burkholderia glumae TaxID=337 RepID=UPI0021516B40|nr:phospholipase D-like domain-containing protein [Burkholderia glumae]